MLTSSICRRSTCRMPIAKSGFFLIMQNTTFGYSFVRTFSVRFVFGFLHDCWFFCCHCKLYIHSTLCCLLIQFFGPELGVSLSGCVGWQLTCVPWDNVLMPPSPHPNRKKFCFWLALIEKKPHKPSVNIVLRLL